MFGCWLLEACSFLKKNREGMDLVESEVWEGNLGGLEGLKNYGQVYFIRESILNKNITLKVFIFIF